MHCHCWLGGRGGQATTGVAVCWHGYRAGTAAAREGPGCFDCCCCLCSSSELVAAAVAAVGPSMMLAGGPNSATAVASGLGEGLGPCCCCFDNAAVHASPVLLHVFAVAVAGTGVVCRQGFCTPHGRLGESYEQPKCYSRQLFGGDNMGCECLTTSCIPQAVGAGC